MSTIEEIDAEIQGHDDAVRMLLDKRAKLLAKHCLAELPPDWADIVLASIQRGLETAARGRSEPQNITFELEEPIYIQLTVYGLEYYAGPTPNQRKSTPLSASVIGHVEGTFAP